MPLKKEVINHLVLSVKYLRGMWILLFLKSSLSTTSCFSIHFVEFDPGTDGKGAWAEIQCCVILNSILGLCISYIPL